MPSAICPYLGLIDDPDTCLAFPTDRNACQRTVPAEMISIEHQSAYCLTYKYTECPIYMGESLPVKSADKIRAQRSRLMRRGCFVIWLIVIVFGVAVLIPLLRNYQRSAAMKPTSVDNMIASPLEATNTPTSDAVPPSLTETAVVVSVLPSPTSCFPPAGWVPYVIRLDENADALASAVGLTIQQLQYANCGANLLNIQAGDAIFLPYVPTETPIPESQLTPSETVISIIIINTSTPTPTLTPIPISPTPYVPPTAANSKPPKPKPPTSRPPSTPPDSRP